MDVLSIVMGRVCVCLCVKNFAKTTQTHTFCFAMNIHAIDLSANERASERSFKCVVHICCGPKINLISDRKFSVSIHLDDCTATAAAAEAAIATGLLPQKPPTMLARLMVDKTWTEKCVCVCADLSLENVKSSHFIQLIIYYHLLDDSVVGR